VGTLAQIVVISFRLEKKAMEDMVGGWGYILMSKRVFHLHPILIRQECRRSAGETRIL